MRTPATHANVGPVACLLAAAVFFLTACGDNDATKAAGADGNRPATNAYMHPVGTMSEADARLFEAAGMGDIAGVELAIELGANINASDMLKRTPLFGAAFSNQTGTANLLLVRGADVNATDFSGFSPLHAGVVAGGKEVVTALLAKGANVNARVVSSRTALHLAAATNQANMVALLLEKGADPQAKDREGLTPAALATRNDHSAISGQIKRWVDARRVK